MVGINADDDIRKEIFDRIQDEAPCEGLDYGDDIEPWLGNRAAVAAVDLGGEDPEAVVVLQVTDADKADAGLDKIKDCAGDEGEEGGWAIEGDWAVIAESDEVADKVVAATKKGSLADDEDFQKWTDEAGDPGVLTIYAGPAAGDYFADHVDELGFPFGCRQTTSPAPCRISSTTRAASTATGCDVDDPSSPMSDDFKQQLRDFEGLAATLRFDDGAIEFESAGDGTFAGQFLLSGGGTADMVTSLPSDTAAAYGLGFADGWFSDLVDYVAPYTGQSADELMDMLSEQSGLDLPGDAETLAGDSAAVALGSDFDPDVVLQLVRRLGHPGRGQDPGRPGRDREGARQAARHGRPRRRTCWSPTRTATPSSSVPTRTTGPRCSRTVTSATTTCSRTSSARRARRTRSCSSTSTRSRTPSRSVADGDDEFIDNLKPIAGFGVTAWVDGDTAHASRAAHDRLTSATIAPVTSMRSAGAISTSRPRRPPET